MATTSKSTPDRPAIPVSKNTLETKLFAICKIKPYLFIAGYGALAPAKMRELGITHAVDASNILRTQRVPGIEYIEVNVNDDESVKISAHFDRVVDFIETAKNQGGKTVVFCAAGISRSATLCIMYLFLKENYTIRNAFIEVARARPLVSPNTGFWRQMIELERQRDGQATVQLIGTGFGRRPVPDVYLIKQSLLNGTTS